MQREKEKERERERASDVDEVGGDGDTCAGSADDAGDAANARDAGGT